MAIEKEIKIKGDTSQSQGVFTKLLNVIKDLKGAYTDANDELNKTPDKVSAVLPAVS